MLFNLNKINKNLLKNYNNENKIHRISINIKWYNELYKFKRINNLNKKKYIRIKNYSNEEK